MTRTCRNAPPCIERRGRLADNLRQLLIDRDLAPSDVALLAGLEPAIVRGLLSGSITAPPAAILDSLAAGLTIDVDLLTAAPHRDAARSFDRRTNPLVDELRAERPHLFDGWNIADFDDLYSRFGAGGELTREGAEECARAINLRRETCAKLALLLETDHADRLTQLIDQWYQEVTAVVEYRMTK